MKFDKFKIIYGVCMALIGAYSFYSYFTGTGLSGWLVKLQFEFFGEALTTLTILLTFVILMIPLEIVRYLVAKKDLADKANNSPSKDEPPFNGVTWIKSLSVPMLAGVFAAALLPAIFGYAIYSYYYAQNQAKLQEQIYDIDLNADSVKIENENYVRLHGNLREDLTYIVENDNGDPKGGTLNETYRPLTSENWDESEPIQFIYYSQGYMPPNVTSVFKTAPKKVFDGEITGMPLPVYVRSEYEKKGMKFAEPLYVVRSDFFTDGKIPDRFYNSYSHIFLYGGIFISFISAFLLLIWKIQPINKI